MATYTATEAQAGTQPKGLRVGLCAVTSFYSFVGSVSATTTVQMVKVPAGATPVLIRISNNSPGDSSFLVGDGNSTGRFLAATTLTAGQGMIVCNLPVGALYTYSVDDTIDILVSTTSIGTLGGALYLHAIFSMDVN